VGRLSYQARFYGKKARQIRESPRTCDFCARRNRVGLVAKGGFGRYTGFWLVDGDIVHILH